MKLTCQTRNPTGMLPNVGAHVGFVGVHVGFVGVHVASVRVFGNQHVGIGNACGAKG